MKLFITSIESDIEVIMFDFLVKIQKWLCIGLYKSPSQNENYFLDILSKVLSKQHINMKMLF